MGIRVNGPFKDGRASIAHGKPLRGNGLVGIGCRGRKPRWSFDSCHVAENPGEFRSQALAVDACSPTTGARTSAYDKQGISPLAGIVVKPLSNVSVSGNFTSGLAQGPTAPMTAVSGGQVFEPYQSNRYEAGVKVDWGRVTTSAAVCQTSRPNGVTGGRPRLPPERHHARARAGTERLRRGGARAAPDGERDVPRREAAGHRGRCDRRRPAGRDSGIRVQPRRRPGPAVGAGPGRERARDRDRRRELRRGQHAAPAVADPLRRGAALSHADRRQARGVARQPRERGRQALPGHAAHLPDGRGAAHGAALRTDRLSTRGRAAT